ncbi:MAG: family 78 glycoside hydrolase catalytic domain [Hyphomonadaceae bacterium]|nr:family 78 glycoside hydrolase catalytic domain [Hyphomonadaceae bacterium]
MQIDRRTLMAAGALGLAPGAASASRGDLRVTCPRTEFLDNPLGIDVTAPRFAWRLESDARGVRQSAYRIVVAGTEAQAAAGVGDLWDSGRVEGDQSIEVLYQGAELAPRQRCFWRVEVWAGDQSAVSAVAWFELGLVRSEEWRAGWIAAEDDVMRADREFGFDWIWGEQSTSLNERGFRFQFELDQPASYALLLLAGKSVIRAAWLNGSPLALPDGPIFGNLMSAIELGPLQEGPNVLAFRAVHENTLAPGQGIGALLRITKADGSTHRLKSGSDWKSAFVNDDAFAARDFDDSVWAGAVSPRVAPRTIPWRTAAVQLRRSFRTRGQVVRARLYATALGAYEAYLNGVCIGDAHMAPDYTDPSKRILYQVYDVTDALRDGDNALGLWVGDGWYASQFSLAGRYAFGAAPRRVLAQLELSYANGDVELVTTDGTDWRVSASPIVYSDIYAGETYDARLEQPGWSAPEFDASGWNVARAAEVTNVPIEIQSGPRIRPMLTRSPARRASPRPGVYVYDFGQNFSGWVRLRARGAAGVRVRLRFAEVLTAEGEIDQANLRSARAADEFILAGNGRVETFEPRFTYHGFRYVEVTGYPGGPPPREAMEGVVAYTACETTGALNVDNPTIDGVWRNAVWSQRSNFFGMPTDCPQRDERLGWMGDAQVFWDAACYNMNVAAFTRKFMDDARHGQNADGAFPDVIPPFAPGMPQGSPGWADAGVILPYTTYRHYGDVSIIANHWREMVAWSDYVSRNNPDFIWRRRRGADYSDWLAVDARFPGDATTPKELVATAMWANSTKLMIDMAAAIGRTEDAARYNELWSNIQRAFVAAFLSGDGVVGNGSQTGYVLALHFGLLPEAARAQAAEHLAADIRRRGDKLSTGFLGTPYILDALADHGHGDVAWSLLLQTDYPSWGYMLRKGATTMWERWNSDVGDVSMNSYNHYAFGAVVGFMFRRVAGIAPGEPGFKTVLIDPLLDPRVTRGGADYESVRGRISTRWRRSSERLNLDVEIPANANARIKIPARGGAVVTEGGRRIEQNPHVQVIERHDAHIVLATGSGRYSFRVA